MFWRGNHQKVVRFFCRFAIHKIKCTYTQSRGRRILEESACNTWVCHQGEIFEELLQNNYEAVEGRLSVTGEQ